MFDLDVDETREEETGTQTKESEHLFVPEPEKPFDENWFINDENKVNFYTALPAFDVSMSVFRHVVNRKSVSLSRLQEFVMIILRNSYSTCRYKIWLIHVILLVLDIHTQDMTRSYNLHQRDLVSFVYLRLGRM